MKINEFHNEFYNLIIFYLLYIPQIIKSTYVYYIYINILHIAMYICIHLSLYSGMCNIQWNCHSDLLSLFKFPDFFLHIFQRARVRHSCSCTTGIISRWMVTAICILGHWIRPRTSTPLTLTKPFIPIYIHYMIIYIHKLQKFSMGKKNHRTNLLLIYFLLFFFLFGRLKRMIEPQRRERMSRAS